MVKIYKSLLNFFLKANCPLCDRPTDEEVCSYCQRQLQRCQLDNPSQFWQGSLPVFAWGEYGGKLKQAIAAMKYNQNPELARPLGHWLGQAWRKAPMAGNTKLTVVPLPMHPRKRQQRGFDQAELLAQYFCQVTGLPLQRKGLERVRETQALFGLAPQERQQEVKEAFRLGSGFRRRQPSGAVLLVDDIYTTGATAKAATQVLKQHGIRVAAVAAVAKPGRQ